jgi:predicted MPP superfamily phosphohydrolase
MDYQGTQPPDAHEILKLIAKFRNKQLSKHKLRPILEARDEEKKDYIIVKVLISERRTTKQISKMKEALRTATSEAKVDWLLRNDEYQGKVKDQGQADEEEGEAGERRARRAAGGG